jgi:small subunit ribosomal protein S1
VDKARQEKSWRRLQQSFDANEVIEAKVINYNKGGLLVNLDGVRGFVPSSQVSGISRGPETQKQSDMAKMVGSSMPLKVIEINRNRNRLILSERQAVQEVREGRKDELLTTLKEGDVRSGVVTSIADFGAFVDIGGADGLVHLSELSWSRVKHPSEILKPGDKVKVYILSVDNDRKRIALSIKRTQNEPRTTVNDRYHLGQVIEGTITQLATFGAFARIEDGVEGLIHVSEMGDGRVQHPRDVVQEGDLIQARIIRIDPARKRMGLSMRQPGEGGAAGEEVGSEESA